MIVVPHKMKKKRENGKVDDCSTTQDEKKEREWEGRKHEKVENENTRREYAYEENLEIQKEIRDIAWS
jgi:hypothetical protein